MLRTPIFLSVQYFNIWSLLQIAKPDNGVSGCCPAPQTPM